MKSKYRNMLLRLLIILFFGGFLTLTVVAVGHGTPRLKDSVQVSVDHESGHHFISTAYIREMVDSYFKTLERLDAAGLKRLEQHLERIPYLQSANAYIDSRGTLHVSVQQRNPVVRVLPKAGGSFYIDDQGMKFPASRLYTAKAPIISGIITESGTRVDSIETKALRNAYEFLQGVAKDPFWAAQIVQVHVAEDGELTLLPRMGMHRIIFGKPDDAEEKLRKLSLFYKHVLNGIGWDAYPIIDLRFKNQIVCK